MYCRAYSCMDGSYLQCSCWYAHNIIRLVKILWKSVRLWEWVEHYYGITIILADRITIQFITDVCRSSKYHYHRHLSSGYSNYKQLMAFCDAFLAIFFTYEIGRGQKCWWQGQRRQGRQGRQRRQGPRNWHQFPMIEESQFMGAGSLYIWNAIKLIVVLVMDSCIGVGVRYSNTSIQFQCRGRFTYNCWVTIYRRIHQYFLRLYTKIANYIHQFTNTPIHQYKYKRCWHLYFYTCTNTHTRHIYDMHWLLYILHCNDGKHYFSYVGNDLLSTFELRRQ